MEWTNGVEENGIDSTAHQIVPDTHWQDMRVLILVVRSFCTFTPHFMHLVIHTPLLVAVVVVEAVVAARRR